MESREQALSPYRWVVLAVLCLGAFIGPYAQFQLPPLACKPKIRGLNLSPSQYASILTAPMIPSIFTNATISKLLGG